MKIERIEILRKAIEAGKIRVDCENGKVYGPKKERGISDGNYLTLTIRMGKNYSFRVHEIIAFVGGLNVLDADINHINGNKLDNRIANLEAVTHKENIVHACTTGLLPTGDKVYNAKLTKKNVSEIQTIIASETMSQREIAKKFNVSPSLICNIAKGKKWRFKQGEMLNGI